MDVIMATALHPHYTPAVLKKIAPDSVAAVKQKIVNELKTAIMSADCAEPDGQQPALRGQIRGAIWGHRFPGASGRRRSRKSRGAGWSPLQDPGRTAVSEEQDSTQPGPVPQGTHVGVGGRLY